MPARGILVVDDDPATVELNAEILRHAGHRVITAHTIEDARRLAQLEKPDVVITGLNLGRANDGLVLAGLVKRISPATQVIMSSGAPDLEHALRDFQKEFDATLPKTTVFRRILIDWLRRAYWEIDASQVISTLQCLNEALDDENEASMRGWVGSQDENAARR